ncbi:conserved hypothetical protein [Flavobacterium sp. 9R]|nr:conserved hypothetical protein [Flavobacterium sp. 9R]
MKLTLVQKITISLLVLYVIWEIIVQIWAQSEETPVLRVDLIFIYPVLFFFILISLYHYLRKK